MRNPPLCRIDGRAPEGSTFFMRASCRRAYRRKCQTSTATPAKPGISYDIRAVSAIKLANSTLIRKTVLVHIAEGLAQPTYKARPPRPRLIGPFAPDLRERIVRPELEGASGRPDRCPAGPPTARRENLARSDFAAI